MCNKIYIYTRIQYDSDMNILFCFKLPLSFFSVARTTTAVLTNRTYLLNSALRKIRELHKNNVTFYSTPRRYKRISIILAVRRLSLCPLGTSETDVISSTPEAIRKYGIPAVINSHILQIENTTVS